MLKGNKRIKILGGLALSSFFLTLASVMAFTFPSGINYFAKEFQEKTTAPPLQEISDSEHQIRVIKKDAVLRLKPKDDSVVLRKLPLGALLDVEKQIDDWLKISLPPDEDGFVVTGYLDKSFTEPSSLIHK